MKTRISTPALGALSLALLVFVGCTPEVQPPPKVVIDNPALGIRLSEIPAGFVVEENEGPLIRLVAEDAELGGEIRISSVAQENGVNLVAAVENHGESFTADRAGEYKGAQELVGPFGTAFFSRGRFVVDGTTREETRIFSLHPSLDAMLVLEYVYPAGEDSSARVTQLLEIFGLVEASGNPS